VKAPRLNAGDHIGMVSSSWGKAGVFPHRFERGVAQLEALGFRVKVGAHALNSISHVSDTPDNRASDIPAFVRRFELLEGAVINLMAMRNDEEHACRVCGRHHEDKPWGGDGASPTFDICDCCGVEFGYEDSTLEAVKKYRAAWIAEGCTWFRPKDKPSGWTWEQQSQNVPERFR
jgi:hypothetical protein